MVLAQPSLPSLRQYCLRRTRGKRLSRILYAPSKRAPTDQMRQKRAPTLVDHKLGCEVVSKPTVLKTPVWRAAGFAALLGLGLISNPVQSAPASGGDTV